MRCQGTGQILRDARERGGLSQRRLALRAGTSQAAISRIERGIESPTIGRLRELLLATGHDLRAKAIVLQPGLDDTDLRAAHELSPAERLRESAAWNRAATALEQAGAAARRAGHPATRSAGR